MAGPGKPGIETIRDPEIVDEILDRLATGEPLAEICRSHARFPHPSTFRNWCRADNDLAIRYAHAREDGEDAIAAECLRIADTPELGQVITSRPVKNNDGEAIGTTEEVRSEDMLGHRKLQIETRLKLLAKWNPKRWGDKTIIGGDEDNPLRVEEKPASTTELARDIAFALALAQKGKEGGDPQP